MRSRIYMALPSIPYPWEGTKTKPYELDTSNQIEVDAEVGPIVEPDPQISLDYVVGGLASAPQEREQARAKRLNRPPGPSDEEIQREADRVMSLGLWKLRQNPYRHAKRRGPRTKRRQFWCPPGCYAAHEASRLDDLEWAFHITLTAPRGAFWASWEIWDGLRAWEALTDRMEYRVFWLLVFARQPETGETHAHLLVGNLNRDQVDKVVAEWPWPDGVKVSPITNKAGGRWAVIHYMQAQTLIKRTDYATTKDYYCAVKREHRRDVFSYYPAVVRGPVESDNLDLLLIMARYRIAATAARKVARRRQGDSDWGRRMAAKRWKNEAMMAETDGMTIGMVKSVVEQPTRTSIAVRVGLDQEREP